MQTPESIRAAQAEIIHSIIIKRERIGIKTTDKYTEHLYTMDTDDLLFLEILEDHYGLHGLTKKKTR